MTARASLPPSERPLDPAGGEPHVAGLAAGPGTPPPDGTDEDRFRGYVHHSGRLEEIASIEDVTAALAQPDAHVWVDLGAATGATLARLGTRLGLHPLVVEDIVERNQRAKVEVTGEVVQLVMFALQYRGEVVTSEVDIVLGDRFLLTSHPGDWDPAAAPLLRRGVQAFLRDGPDYLLWAIVDYLVDGYFPVFDKIGDEIDDLQDDVIGRPNPWIIERLFQVRRDLLAIRHAVTPQREIFNQLTNRDLQFVRPERQVYYRDVYDHLIRLTDELDSYRELVSTTLDAYLSTVNNNLSEIMKRLTAVTAVLAGVGAVAGIFGMSEAGLALAFAEAPGFWVVTALIVVLGAGAVVYFRRIGWI